jgi:acetyltransferase
MSTLHLDALLNPSCIAVVGASARQGSKGYALMHNIVSGGFAGTLYPVNPRYDDVEGLACLDHIKDCPTDPDLVIAISPERTLKKVLKQSAQRGVRVVLIMSTVKDSAALHAQARKLNIRLLGPYCAGLIRPSVKLNASYSVNTVNAGRIGLISQSASLAAALLDWAEASNVGFSALLSTGRETDIALGDLLDLLAEDHHTRAIIVYVDHLLNVRSFMSAISAAARIKPVIIMKSAVDSAEYCDLFSQTGEVFSSDIVFQAAMQRAGVVRIRTFMNLYTAGRMLESGMRTTGKRVAIISNGAAPALLAVERLKQRGLSAPELPRDIRLELKPKLNPQWSRANPIVLRETNDLPSAYAHVLDAFQKQSAYDAVVVIYVPDSVTPPKDVAQVVIDHRPKKMPIALAWMGDQSVRDARNVLAEEGLPTFRTPESAIDCIDFLHRYYVSQQQLLQLPNPMSRTTEADLPAARALIEEALDQGERVLGPQKARKMLSFFNINTQAAVRVMDEENAVRIANDIGYPVAIKIVSPNLMHKAAVAETRLDVSSDAEVRRIFEHMMQALAEQRPGAEFRGVLIEKMHSKPHSRSLSLGIHQDPTFGPVISLSIGGDSTPISRHRSVQLPPLNQFLIDQMLDEPTMKAYLDAWQYKPAVSRAAVAAVLRRLSEIATEMPDVFSLDINPLEVSEYGAVALGIRVVLERKPSDRPYTQLAIHPYPLQWQKTLTNKHGNQFLLRPIRPTDGESIRELVRNMSAESRYFRFMHALNDLSPRMVVQFTKLDYDRQMAFVAVPTNAETIVGVSRYTIDSRRVEGDFAIAIDDDFQGQGLASALMRHLIEHARAQSLQRIRGDVLRTNIAMQGLMTHLGFTATTDPEDSEILVYRYTL